MKVKQINNWHIRHYQNSIGRQGAFAVFTLDGSICQEEFTTQKAAEKFCEDNLDFVSARTKTRKEVERGNK